MAELLICGFEELTVTLKVVRAGDVLAPRRRGNGPQCKSKG